MTEKITLRIEGMTCNHCVMHVTRALKSLSGVNNAEVSLEKKNAEVSYDPSVVSLEEMIKAVNETGYQAMA
jgi:copper chaperone